ncbi:MAG TPA: hypothetical protein VFA39_02675 [Steroidobacteraceae bacterium]|jgi:hypothetical protein|nr:hypothetical protein [Steroidobacteraceae bacterium]
MSAQADELLLEKLRALPPERRAEVEDFIDFLSDQDKKRAAWDRLLAIAPALEAAGIPPMSTEEIDAEIRAARAERRARLQQAATKDPSADKR